ncbi:unnamed protein product, partial [marine sediment metagenome]
MVVGLNLKTQCPATIKINNPGIILKDRKAPRLVQFIGYFHYGMLEQVIYGYIAKLDVT